MIVSMLPVTTSTSTPNKGATNATTPQSAPSHIRKSTLVQKTSTTESKGIKMVGDQSKMKIVPPTPTTSKHFVNEPIARSIAGYVVNNIPNKLQTFKWIKATKKDSS